jgi:putative ABC transport system permease protein
MFGVGITLFLGIALFGASYDAYLNLQASYQALYEQTRFADVTITGGDLGAVAAAATRSGATVQERTQADVPMKIGDASLLGRVVGMPAGTQPAVDRVLVQEGTGLSASSPDGVLVEQHAASHFHLAPGDTVRVYDGSGWRDASVLGTAASPEYLWPARSRQDLLTSPDDFAVLFAPEATVAALAGGAAEHQVLVYVPDRSRVDAVVADVTAAARRAGATDVITQAEQPSNAALLEDVQGFNELSFLFPILFLTAAAMSSWVLLTRLVQSQRSQIGTMRAFGASRRTLLGHYVGFGLVAGLSGAVPGAIVGALLARTVTRLYTSAISVPIVVAPLHLTTVLIGVAFGVVVGILAAAGPALRASRVQPAEAMRGLLPSGGGGRSFLERIAPPLGRLPITARMAMRGIGRDRRRTVYTALGVVLALTLILVSWGMLDTTQVLLARQFDVVQRQDAQVYLRGPVDTASVGRLGSVQGVAAAEPVAELPATLGAGDRSYATSLFGMQPDTAMHGFVVPGGATTELPASGLLVGKAVGSQLDVGVGDRVQVDLGGGTTFDEPIAGFLDEPLGTFAYGALPGLEAAAGSGSLANTVFLRFDPGVSAQTMRERISAQPDVAAYVDARALDRAAGAFLGLFYGFVGMMLVFGALLAFVLIFNTMSVNIAERSGEVATLRSEGVGQRRLARMIAGENLLVVAIGIVPGLLLGYLVAKSFMASFSSDLFSFDLAIHPMTLVWSALAMIVVALISQWPGLRAVRRLDLASVLRERTG